MILRGARVIDGRGTVHDEAAVQFDREDGRFTAVGDASRRSEDERVVDLDGGTILPGVVDAHVHFSLSGESSVETAAAKSDPNLLLTEAGNARTTLESGVTAVRAMGARDLDVELKRGVERGDVVGPRMVSNCRSITITGGHGYHLGREVDGADDCRRAVREQIKCGADFIKFMATGGVTTPGTDPNALAFTRDEVHAIVDEAHRRGVHVAAHAHGAQAISVVANAGVDTVEHGTFLDDEAIQAMLDNDVTLVPTLSAPYRIMRNTEQATAASVRKSTNVHERHLESFADAVEAGVTVAGGTDAGTPFNNHGTNYVEMQFMARHGMEPMEALTAMTGNAADAIELDDAGTIEAGNYADLVIVDGNPAEDISAVEDLRTVVKGGEVVAGTPPERLARPETEGSD